MSRIRFTTAGESHGPALVSILEGVPAGLGLLAAVAVTGCKSLDITNPNEPDAARALADPAAIDKGLRCRLDVMFGLERVGLRARLQPMIVDGEALSFEEMLRFQAIGTDMLRHDHAVEDGALRHDRHVGTRPSCRQHPA